MKKVLRHMSSFIAPVVVGMLLPALIVYTENQGRFHAGTRPPAWLVILGLAAILAGLTLFIITVRLFILIGNGTIMPWDPTRKLIVAGVYRHVRNPMILSVLLVLIGEAILFTSSGIALLAIFFFLLNTIYFMYSEEPGLEKRFGKEYLEYKQNVPRWIPRRKPWGPA